MNYHIAETENVSRAEIVMDHNIQKPNHIIASPAKSMASVIAAPAKLARVEFNLF